MKFSKVYLSHLDIDEVARFAEVRIVLALLSFEDLIMYVTVSASRCQVCLNNGPLFLSVKVETESCYST